MQYKHKWKNLVRELIRDRR